MGSIPLREAKPEPEFEAEQLAIVEEQAKERDAAREVYIAADERLTRNLVSLRAKGISTAALAQAANLTREAATMRISRANRDE